MSHTEPTADVIEFARACGQHRPVQLVLNQFAEGEPKAHRVERPFVLIGRAADCDIRLRHPEVSYRHAYLQIVNGRALCVDLASRTGTRWKTGTKSYGWIEPGEDVGIGPFELSFHDDGHALTNPASGDPTGSPADGSLPTAALEFLNGHDASDKPRLWPLRRSVTLLGASPACNVQLRHESISRVHCSLVLTSGGLWVIDLLGRHGTRVNDATVRCARLNDGDELQIGRFRMAVRLGRAETQPRSEEESFVPPPQPAKESAQDIASDVAAHTPPSAAAPDPEQSAAALSPPRAPANGEASAAERMYSERFILGLMDQFAAMHQQAMAQNQHQMMMLMQFFSSVHESQQELIREELARVHEINRKLQELQSEMARQQATRYLTQHAAPEVAAGQTAIAPGRPVAKAEASEARETSAETPTTPPPEPAVTSLDDSSETAEASERVEESREQVSEPVEEIPSSEAADLAAASDIAPASKETSEEEPPAAPEEWTPAMQHPDADAHAWLARQMHLLEREREGRWRKILRMVGAGRL